ncbi:MAG: hypothetical protein KDD12_08215 [Lewinella sp.]|nr:hypothetical protein [Lewinella sp.]
MENWYPLFGWMEKVTYSPSEIAVAKLGLEELKEVPPHALVPPIVPVDRIPTPRVKPVTPTLALEVLGLKGDGPKLFAPPGRGSMSHPASTVCPLSGRADKVKTRKKKENTCGKNLNFILSSFNYVNHEF